MLSTTMEYMKIWGSFRWLEHQEWEQVKRIQSTRIYNCQHR